MTNQSHKLASGRFQRRRGFFSFDAAIAVVAVIFMVYFSSLVIHSIESSIKAFQSRERNIDLLLLSNQIIRRDAAVSGTSYIANVISELSVEAISVTISPRNHNFKGLSFQLVSDSAVIIEGNRFYDPNVYCIDRIVVVDDVSGRPPAVLKVCGS